MNISQRLTFNLALLNLVGKSAIQLCAMTVLSPFKGAFRQWNMNNIPPLIQLIDGVLPMSDEGKTTLVLTNYKATLEEFIPQDD